MNDTPNNHYLVRTLPELVHQGLVGIGWSDFDFSSFADAEEAIQAINDDYGIGRRGNQIRRFFNISEGDFIVTTLPYTVVIGRAKGSLLYDRVKWYGHDRANIRKVDFPVDPEGNIVEIPRANFSEGFQRRIRVMGITVNDLSDFSDEIERAYNSAYAGTDHSWKSQINEQKEERSNFFKVQLLKNIQSGKTNLRGGGLGLEALVSELLQIDGYNTSIFAKSAFQSFADADIRAVRNDRFSQTELLVQVKHHQGWSGEHGINQLTEIRNQHPEQTEGTQLIFVTSASIPHEVQMLADKKDIITIDGESLVSWIEVNLSQLTEETKQSLGIFESQYAIE